MNELNLIDCHIHTACSHHGFGTLREGIEKAIEIGIRVIGFSEHAPLPFDREHRMTQRETIAYLRDLTRLQRDYADYIVILKGLEIDYFSSYQQYIYDMLSDLSYDYAIGSVHFLETAERRISIWDFDEFQNDRLVSSYFEALESAIGSGMFEIIAHPDIILRAGVKTDLVRKKMNALLPSMCTTRVGYEINCSGITKTKYDPVRKIKTKGPSYPDLELAVEACHRGVLLSVGSDSHETALIGKNVAVTLERLYELGVKDIAYFRCREAVPFVLSGSEPHR